MPGAGPTHHPFSLVIAASTHNLQARGYVRLRAVAALKIRFISLAEGDSASLASGVPRLDPWAAQQASTGSTASASCVGREQAEQGEKL